MLKNKRIKLTQLSNKAGIQESFSVVYDADKDEDIVKMIVGLNMLGQICKPYILSQALGLVPLAEKLAMTDIRTFIRSHKSLYFLTERDLKCHLYLPSLKLPIAARELTTSTLVC